VSHRTLIILLILLALAVALSASSGVGPMIGFLFALVVVMPGGAIGAALDQAGGAITGQELGWILTGLYGLLVFAAVIRTWRLFSRRDLNEARVAGFQLALLVALPLMVWLSLKAMVGGWP
jgi:hypothetical protein